MSEEAGTLKLGEPHPAAKMAYEYLAGMDFARLAMFQESFASCAIESNRLAEICSETLGRFMRGDPISDRYLLGLAWTVKTMEENELSK